MKNDKTTSIEETITAIKNEHSERLITTLEESWFNVVKKDRYIITSPSKNQIKALYCFLNKTLKSEVVQLTSRKLECKIPIEIKDLKLFNWGLTSESFKPSSVHSKITKRHVFNKINSQKSALAFDFNYEKVGNKTWQKFADNLSRTIHTLSLRNIHPDEYEYILPLVQLWHSKNKPYALMIELQPHLVSQELMNQISFFERNNLYIVFMYNNYNNSYFLNGDLSIPQPPIPLTPFNATHIGFFVSFNKEHVVFMHQVQTFLSKYQKQHPGICMRLSNEITWANANQQKQENNPYVNWIDHYYHIKPNQFTRIF